MDNPNNRNSEKFRADYDGQEVDRRDAKLWADLARGVSERDYDDLEDGSIRLEDVERSFQERRNRRKEEASNKSKVESETFQEKETIPLFKRREKPVEKPAEKKTQEQTEEETEDQRS